MVYLTHPPGNLGSCVAGNRQHQPPPPAAQELAMKGDGGDRGGGWGSRSRCRCSSRRTDQFQRKSESGNTSEMVRVNEECKCEIFARERMHGERRRRDTESGVGSQCAGLNGVCSSAASKSCEHPYNTRQVPKDKKARLWWRRERCNCRCLKIPTERDGGGDR